MNLAKLPELNDNQIKLLTLINIRWVAIFGQFTTISIVYFYFNFSFNIGYCYLLVLFSSFLNIFLKLRSKKTDLLSNKQATFSILYDLFQLFGLLFLTGGLTNPFSILIVAPITIAAGFLNLRSSVLIGFLSIVLIIILSFFYFELPGLEKNYLFPKFYILGSALALCTAIIFLAIYSQRLAIESAQRSEAFNVLQQIFLREQELKSLGGLAAAAAHELGTPLNTISLVAKELKKEINTITGFEKEVKQKSKNDRWCKDNKQTKVLTSFRSVILYLKYPIIYIDYILKKLGIFVSNALSKNKATDSEKKIVIGRMKEIIFICISLFIVYNWFFIWCFKYDDGKDGEHVITSNINISLFENSEWSILKFINKLFKYLFEFIIAPVSLLDYLFTIISPTLLDYIKTYTEWNKQE